MHATRPTRIASSRAKLAAGLPAVQSGDVFAVDASSYFARPGPRVFDGIECSLTSSIQIVSGSGFPAPR